MSLIYPSLEEAKNLVKNHSLLPLCLDILSDTHTPIGVLKTLKAQGKNACILESVESGENWGRYTFLGFDPLLTVKGSGDETQIIENSKTQIVKGNPHQSLKKIIQNYQSPKLPNLPPFTGGFIGYFAYEYARYVEPALHLNAANPLNVDDFELMLFDKVIAFDHFAQKIHLIVNIKTDCLAENYAKACETLQKTAAMIEKGVEKTSAPTKIKAPQPLHWQASFSEEKFCAAVQKIKHHIVEGDIFQCVPSIRFSADYEGDLLPAYRKLRTINPSSYMFYIDFGHMQIAGASPETLVSLKDGQLATYPLAGTCKRFADDKETESAIAALLNDPKELAEHDMLVDLGRNDIGKISQFGSVKVAEYRKIKRCSHVCHISSKVTGVLQAGLDAFDAIAAVIPAGTLSGAPKKRAMEIIDSIESEKRGVYGGAVGYIDFSGNMDLCIGIRMAFLKDQKIYVQAGAGIVFDSEPAKEYAECVSKAAAMKKAIDV